MQDTQYIITPAPPVRGFIIAAVLTVLGAGVWVAGAALKWGVWSMVVGIVLVVLGVLLMIVGFVAMRVRRSTVLFTARGYRLDGPGGTQSGTWQGVIRVTRNHRDRRLTIYGKKNARTQLVFTPGAGAQFEEMLDDLVRRLDAAKGYRKL